MIFFSADHSFIRITGENLMKAVVSLVGISPDLTEPAFQQELDSLMDARPKLNVKGVRAKAGFSVGCAHGRLDAPDSLRKLFAAADERMCRVKRGKGRAG